MRRSLQLIVAAQHLCTHVFLPLQLVLYSRQVQAQYITAKQYIHKQ